MQLYAVMLIVLICLLSLAAGAPAATTDLGHGFRDHGVATPVSNHRGVVATKDGNGRDVVLVWLMDHRGCYELLMIDAETGHADQYPIPAKVGGDSPFASILGSNNRFYTQFGSHFFEFDPVQRKFTFVHETAPQMAMGMTEDDHGVIWAASYPQSGIVSFNPATREFKDYGHVYQQDWQQYQRYIATDDAGYVYIAVGNTASQILIFNPATGKATPVLAEGERKHGTAYVYRDLDGKVYGQAVAGKDEPWYELYKGQARKIGELPHEKHEKHYIAASQSLFYNRFPDGKILKSCDTVDRVMVVEDPKTKQEKTLHFDYTSEGAHIMGMCAAPNGTMCGGTAFPMRFFSYNPVTDTWVRHRAFLQFNTVVTQGDRWFTGGYGHGFLLEWDPTKPWVDTVKGKPGNPLWLADAEPDINRPHHLLAYPDGHTLILAGTPGYGLTGGGLLIWDRQTKQATVLKHTQLLPEQSTMSMVALPDGKVLGGTTTAAGTGGQVKAKQAELYIFDLASKQIEWHAPLLPGVQSYTDMVVTPDGMVCGFADWHLFFVFDPQTRKIVMEKDVEPEFGRTNGQQGPRTFVTTPDHRIYILFIKGIAELDPETYQIHMVAQSPVPIGAGGDYLDGRIYFASGSHVYSWQVPGG